MSNAKKKDAQRQDRRLRALKRITFHKRHPGESEASYKAYQKRKNAEIYALRNTLAMGLTES